MDLNKESNSTSTLNMGMGLYSHICAVIVNVNCQPDENLETLGDGHVCKGIIIFERLFLFFILLCTYSASGCAQATVGICRARSHETP